MGEVIIFKNKKYIKKVGIVGIGDDYNIYILSAKEKLIGFITGLFSGFIGFYILFDHFILSIILAIVTGFFAIQIYKNYLHKKQKRVLLLEFRDLLDFLGNSFSSGKNTQMAFIESLNDMKLSYGENSIMCKESEIIQIGLNSNFTIEELLLDMALRLGLDDITSFAETFAVCNRMGGNLKTMITKSRDIINSKIEVEMEIQTNLAANKNELNIMAILPFVIILCMKVLGNDSIATHSTLNVIVKIIAVAIFATSYYIGRKIIDIKV